MKGPYFIGLDIGTSGCRAVLYNLNGEILSLATREYPLEQPQPGWVEQDPQLVYTVVCKTIKQCVLQGDIDNKNIAGIGLSCVFHSLIALDGKGELLSNAIIWADNRSTLQAEELKKQDNHIYNRTGCPVHPMYPLAKILWLKQLQPEKFYRVAKFISLKEYLIKQWFGNFMIDLSIASTSGLLNIHSLKWDDDCLKLVGIRATMLSEVVPVTQVAGNLRGDIARQLGVPEGTPVVIGSGDGFLSNLGSGATRPGQMVAMIGTSGAIRVLATKPHLDPRGRTWCYAFDNNLWLIGGAINNGGIVYQWFKDLLGQEEVTYESLNDQAAKVKPGAGGLLFLPFLTGERSPNWNPNARGVIFGLALHHKKEHMVRALLEGVSYRMYSVYEAIKDLISEPKDLRIAGGFTRSNLWCQIMADIFGRPLKISAVPEVSSLGAALMAMWGLGYVESFTDVNKMVRIEREFIPDKSNEIVYRQLYALYQQIYQALEQQFKAISDFQKS